MVDATTDRHESEKMLSAQDLLAGSTIIHDVEIPGEILAPRSTGIDSDGPAPRLGAGKVRIKPLSVAVITLIARAARDDESLVPLLMIKEAMVEPQLTLEQIRQIHIGLVHYLVGRINMVSGLTADGETIDEAAGSPISQAHVLLARHFGWTPQQVSQLTPGQVAVYLAGIERLLRLDGEGRTP